MSAPRLLLISASDYQSAVVKGVASMLTDFDEGGFFSYVLVAFPLAKTSTKAAVSERVVAQDIGADWLSIMARSRRTRRLLAPLHLVRVTLQLAIAARRQELSIVRATDPCFAGLIGWAVARLARRAFCVSIHADFDKRHELGGASAGATVLGSRGLARRIERFVLSRADMVLPIRESLRHYALRAGAPAQRVRVIPHGTDLSLFVQQTDVDIRSLFGFPSDVHVVSFIGRLVVENYIDDILEMAARLGRNRRDFVVLIVGGGLEETRVRATVDNNPVLSEVVRVVGFQPRPVVAAVRQASAASLCLMGGYSLIEACASASPVIAYDVEWHDELIAHGRSGFLISEHDIDALTFAVNRLLDDSVLRADLGAAARREVLARHDLAVTTEIKRRCYRELLAESSVTSGQPAS